MQVPLLDLKAQYSSIRTEVERAVTEVLASQHFILGPRVKECERLIANYSRCAHAVGVSSGTDALLVALMAEGIGPGDEVITTPYTFFATAGSIARLGARPVFVDIEPGTYNLDPSQIEAKCTQKTRAIIPVHLYGQMADMEAILRIAGERNLVVIEDAAQAIGAEYQGKRAGSCGHYGCFSFFPSKNLGGAGDGGMVVTNDPVRAENLMRLRSHGSRPKYYHQVVGGNFRLDEIQAAVIAVKMKYLDAWTAARQRNAQRYEALFQASGLRIAESGAGSEAATKGLSVTVVVDRDGPPDILLPRAATTRHVFNQYVIRTGRRDELKAYLAKAGVGSEIYYPVPMHLQACFSYLGQGLGAFPASESAAKETLALPIYPEVSDAQAEYVVRKIRDFLKTLCI